IPIQLTMDKGSEIGWQHAIQDAVRFVRPICRSRNRLITISCRHAFAPDIDIPLEAGVDRQTT
ncbi:hypothetical protein DFH09DRAFT_942061, partial [Mycena vulgaris]